MGSFARTAIATVLAMVVAACGGGQAAPAASGQAGTAPPAAASAGKASSVEQAQKDAQAKGLAFAMTHDEILAKAKAEGGQLRELMNFGKDPQKAIIAGFQKAYPFIALEMGETTGTEEQRFLLELQAGSGNALSWDVRNLNIELFNDLVPYMWKVDVYGMAQQNVLAIDPRLVDPTTRSAVGLGTAGGGIAYNKKLFTADKLPKTWDDIAKPEFSGRKFLTDIAGTNLACLVPLKGEAYVVDLAKKIAAQKPIWTASDTKSLTAMGAGEYQMDYAVNIHSTVRARGVAPDSIEIAVIDPVPLRLAHISALLKSAKHPYSGLLFLEWMASADGQKVLDDFGPVQSSPYVKGSKVEQLTAGKQISFVGWGQIEKLSGWSQKIVEAFGFPKADIQ